MEHLSPLRSLLRQKCLEYAESRISAISQAISSAADAANDDTKSTAGDKHETGRAMAQLEQEKNAKALKEALEMKNALLKIDPAVKNEVAALGSIVATDKGNFYLSIAAGRFFVENESYYAVSPASPIGKLIIGIRSGKTFDLNGNTYTVSGIL